MKALVIGLAASLVITMVHAAETTPTTPASSSVTTAWPVDKAALGERLFFDVSLSKNRTQSCATCHNPAHGFIDNRSNTAEGAVSLGDDGQSLGDRNAPTAAYASFSPLFHKTKQGKYVGGQFLDGREPDLKGQAGGPPLNPVEMGMPNQASVVARLQENQDYVAAFKKLFGDSVFDTTEAAYEALTESLAAFEKTPFFAPFDSRYDRYLRGEIELTEQESLGESLFFSHQFTNCSRCHQLKMFPGVEGETFSNYEYHNLGVPLNAKVRQLNGKPSEFRDLGLKAGAVPDDSAQAGRFKVPTLRNIAVTGPYMHNGVFKDLRTVLLFYDQFNHSQRALNPETNAPWAEPEVAENIALKTEEFKAPPLKNSEIDALLAFLKTLTDQRYEGLLDATVSINSEMPSAPLQ